MDMFIASGIIGYIITLLSVIALGFVIEHAMTIRKSVVMPDQNVADLDNLIRHGQLDEALQYCQQPDNQSLFTNVVMAGLERYRSSEFGFAEYKAAVEEAGEEQTSGLYRKTEVLGVIGAIAPMLGLLGTVQGMILGFNTIANTGGNAKPEDLAASISLALVTTFEGLVVAIPAMVAFSFFRNRIDTLVAEAGKRVEQVLGPLSRRRT
jgi:biopolymer transport protein ExbB